MDIKKAKDLMEGFCKVCQKCDGKACAGEVPGMGGTGSGSSFIANIEALSKIKFIMKVFKTTKSPITSTNLLGLNLDIPIMAAPIGGVPFNMSKKVSEEEYALSLLKGCFDQGIIGCTGDGPPDYVYQAGYKAIKNVDGNGIPFIKPWEDKMLFKKIEEAKQTGTTIIGMDIDSIALSNVKLFGASIPLRTPKQLEKIISKIPFKVILKGIMDPEDAQIAFDIGADAIVVSNHGGRVLDYTKGTAEVLPEIVNKIENRIPVIVDGGIRSGADVLKMLALGANAIMIGRPLTISVFSDINNGVSEYLKQIKKELVQSMLLTGCENISTIGPEIIDFYI